MMFLRTFILGLLASLLVFSAGARESIESFDVRIEVETDGDIIVSEAITTIPQGNQIRRGIFRDLPRYYALESGERFKYDYDILSITRNGEKEPYHTSREGNAFDIRIGDEDVFLPVGMRQTYLVRYRVKNQIRYFEDHDELYWNVTGNYWAFPIEMASADIEFPEGAQFTDISGYTGGYGTSGTDYESAQTGNNVIFKTTRPLPSQNGLTVSVSIAKGLIDPPSAADKFNLLWQRYVGLALLAISLLGVLIFYYTSWKRVGIDAAKLPVFPQYHPPKGISPAAAHQIYYRQLRNNEAFSATLIYLAIKGLLKMETEKKSVTLTRTTPDAYEQLPSQERKLYDRLFTSDTRVIGGKYDSGFASLLTSFNSSIKKTYGNPYFRANTGYVVLAIVMSVIAFLVANAMIINWSIWHVAMIAGLIIVNIIFMYLMPAQTQKGEKARSEIAGLRLYLETAEKLQMNTADIEGEKPPAMSKARYEELLPYAMALNVEEPWSKYFEKVLPEIADNYQPGWGSHYMIGRSLHATNTAISSAIASGVSTASVNPSSSSGSGGGGFSGGGGGGGGGGGW